jgi:predicted Fe-S protein YdhL (DUF1289 family)
MNNNVKKVDVEKQEVIASPCVRNCCLKNDDVCIGCFRHLDEIMGWQRASNENKSAILLKCQQRREQEQL